MQHLDEGTIHAWLDGALPTDEAARVERHASECSACAAMVAEARGLMAGASRILASLDDVPAVVRSVGGAGRGAAAEFLRPPPPARRPFWSRPAVMAAAASVVLMAGSALVVQQSRHAPQSVASRVGTDSVLVERSIAVETPATAPGVASGLSDRSADGRRGAAEGLIARAPATGGTAGRIGGPAGEARQEVARREEAAPRPLAADAAQRAAAAPAPPVVAPRPVEPQRLESAVVPLAPTTETGVVQRDAASAARKVVPANPSAPSGQDFAMRRRAAGAASSVDAVAQVETLTVPGRVDTIIVESPSLPAYRQGRAAPAPRVLPITACYQVVGGKGLPRTVTLTDEPVWSGAAEQSFVATAPNARGYWSQPRTGNVHLVINNAIVTARIDPATGELRGKVQRGNRSEPFLARRGCR